MSVIALARLLLCLLGNYKADTAQLMSSSLSSSPLTPSVSICIPAYKAEAFIAETLACVRGQTFTDWELIVTEDGTKDRTEEIVAAFAKTAHQAVIYNRHAVNQGLPSTRNTGIKSARGQWIAFLDSDDLWLPNHLSSLVDRAVKSNDDIVFAGSIRFDHDTKNTVGENIPTPEQLQSLPIALYMGSLSIMPSSVMIKRHAFERFGLISAEFPHVNDTEFWLRVLRGGGRISYAGNATCLYRQHAGSMSKRSSEILEDSARLCQTYRDWSVLPPAGKRSRSANLYRWAAQAALAADPIQAFHLLKRSLRIDPFNSKSLLSFPRFALRSFSHRRSTA